MVRIISSEMVECGDGMRSVTVYDSRWCKHKVDKEYCEKCNIIKEKKYHLTRSQLRKILKIPKDFKIKFVYGEVESFSTNDGVIVMTEKKRRRKNDR